VVKARAATPCREVVPTKMPNASPREIDRDAVRIAVSAFPGPMPAAAPGHSLTVTFSSADLVTRPFRGIASRRRGLLTHAAGGTRLRDIQVV
jgi:hypothetical protein